MKALMPCLAATLLLSGHAIADTAAGRFGARLSPATPTLTLDSEPDLCKQVLADVSDAFASAEAGLEIATAVQAHFAAVPMKSALDDAPADAPTPLSVADLDLDGTGKRQVVVYRDNAFNWRGDWHYAYVFPSVADYESSKPRIATDWAHTPERQDVSPAQLDHSARPYYPRALTKQGPEIETGDVWAEHSLFEAGGHYYFATAQTAIHRPSLGAGRVFRLHADGRVEVACEVGNDSVDKFYEALQKLPAMGAFLKTIRAIGAGGNDSGTLQSGRRHDAQAMAAEIRAATRPWATSAETEPQHAGGNTYYGYDGRTRAFLEGWSLQELWNRREYQTLLELTGPAEASYAAYLRSAFGVSEDAAKLDATKVVEALIGARIEVPAEFSADDVSLYFPSTPLRQAVLRRDRAAFDGALASPLAGTEKFVPRPKDAEDAMSGALADAVEWPYALGKLLAAGADPNRANAFGKTPLMVAAHFDRPDAVRMLLKAGGKVSAATSRAEDDDANTPARTGRTALMYAAENSGAVTIKALLDGGADTSIKDSEGHDLSDYLARNPRFSAGERALGVNGIAAAADQLSGPSFPCAKARTATERAICDSEVLRSLDLQIARAFAAVKSREGALAAAEQLQWLRSRDQSCRGDADCLAETMRTHLRALHRRDEE